jgi:hypothetical protein
MEMGFASSPEQFGKPSLSIRWVHLPLRVPPSLTNEPFWCRIVRLLAIAYDYDVLGLGPD